MTPGEPHDIEQVSAPAALQQYLRASEVAKLLSMSPSNVYKQIDRGELPSVKIGGSVRVPARALMALLEQATQIARPARPEVSTLDPHTASLQFAKRAGSTPHAYVASWRAGEIEDTPASARLAEEALAVRAALDAATLPA